LLEKKNRILTAWLRQLSQYLLLWRSGRKAYGWRGEFLLFGAQLLLGEGVSCRDRCVGGLSWQWSAAVR